MRQLPLERRLLLKAGLAALLGLTGHAALADILETGDPDANGGASDGLKPAQLRLGKDLIRILAGRRKSDAGADNFVASPASLAAILAFVDMGASRPLRSAIHRVLGFRRAAKADRDLRALRTGVSAVIARSGKDGPLALANLLAFDRSARPRQMTLYALSGAGADVLVDDLGDAKIIGRINAWVRQKTHDLIPSIIEEAPESLGLVAINALYFKDRWQIPFDPVRTESVKFQVFSGAPVDVPMMHSGVRKFRFRQDDRFIAAELAYAHEDFRLVVITTRSEPAAPSDFAAVSGWLGGEEFAAASGEIALPKLRLSATEELLSPLDALGLSPVRLARDALDGFSPESLAITRVVQKLELRFDEEGTEAAAATAVVTTRSVHVDDHVRMVVDKPFVFALRDEKSGLILLMGYVGRPASGA